MKSLITVIVVLAVWAQSGFCEPVFVTDMVFAPHSFGRPHGASLIELGGGDILATWYSAKEETDSDSRIYGAVWKKDTGKWTAPRVIIPSGYSKSVGNTALFRDDDGIIWMFFAAVRVGGWSGAMVDYVQSRDNGATWSGGKTLVWLPGNLPRNPPIRVGDHKMLVPLFVDFMYEANLVGSYTALIKYKDGAVLEKKYASLDDYDSIQPAIVKLPNGKILLLARDKTERFMRRAFSANNGKSWSPVSITNVPNPGSGISAIFIRELNAVLLAYNHSHKERNPLCLAVSTDGGLVFRRVADVESRKGAKKSSFSYPALLRTHDGMIHMIWSHDSRATLKHARFNLDWLKKVMGNADPIVMNRKPE